MRQIWQKIFRLREKFEKSAFRRRKTLKKRKDDISINLQKIVLSQAQVIGNDSCPVISVTDAFVYENGKRTEKTAGKKVTCVCPRRDYEKISVRVPSVPITQEQIDAAAEDGKHIFVTFENFEGRIYIDKAGRPQISAKATDVKIFKE